ncbi:MAG: phosphoglycerate dehydrogenase [Oscillospiraceae bacterium]|nr:phosphoglycerate dehydrogenase [Oscillospiraceae bacterium]
MYDIKTLNKIAACGTDLFDKAKYNVADDPANPVAIMVRSASMHEMEFGKDLLAIGRAGAGVNNIPVDRCAEEGIVVFNTPGANANAVKELVLAGLLLSSRKITKAIEWAKTLKDEGDQVGKLVEKGKSQFAGPEIQGKTLGVIGLGAIGAKVANAAIHLGMKVVGTDPFLSVEGAQQLNHPIKVVKTREEVYAQADYLTLHLPFNAETKGMLNADVFAQMNDGARVLNFARGELVNDEDMQAALESGKIACYVTDFPNAKTVAMDGVIAIPHLGASSPESEDNCAIMAAKELIDYIENGNIKNSVNFPNAVMNANGTKLCILHKNVPAIISSITSELAAAGLNIDNMVNASKKDYAYTMVDVAGDVSADVAAKFEAMENVIRVRVITK